MPADPVHTGEAVARAARERSEQERETPRRGASRLDLPARSLRVAICQVNPTVGDLEANVALAAEAQARAEAAGADLAVLPELAITGYPPEDLVLRPGFVAASRAALDRFAARTGSCAAVVGFVDGAGETSRRVPDMAGVESFSEAFNAVAVCAAGEVRGVYRKRHLPNYDVFDELRHFRPGVEEPPLFEIGGAVVGVTVCEDAWVPDGPVSDLARAGAQLVVNVNGSPFRAGKQAAREQVIGRRVAEAGVAVVCVNLVGGQDELVFDGGSFMIASDGSVAARCVSFAESVEVFDVDLPPRKPMPPPQHRHPVVAVTREGAPASGRQRLAAPIAPPMDLDAQRWAALVLATGDYVHKSGFSDVCVGLSGGVDSSLTAAVAVDALGADHVHGVLMPSRNSSEHSVTDAEKLAANLGIDARIVGIEPGHAALAEMIEADLGRGLDAGGLTDQNLQARVRGHDPDGAGQRARLAGAHHRQQERAGRGLLDPVRRHGRRVRGGLGSLETRRLRVVPLAQPAGRKRTHPGDGAGQGAVGRAGARPARRPVVAVLRGARSHPAAVRGGAS